MDADKTWARALRAIEETPADATVAGPASLSLDALAATRRLLAVLEPRACLELGSGRSTVEIAQAFAGRFVSLDHSRRYLDATRRRLDAEDLAGRVDLHHAPSVWRRRSPFAGRSYNPDVLQGTFDLVLIDGPPARAVGRLMTLPIVWPHLTIGGIAIVDDARRRVERRALAAWETAFGPAIRVARFNRFAKGLALVQKLEAAPRGRASAGWLASTVEAAWTWQWRLRRGLLD
jgi:predicted O-methyltransferase YrrM